MSQANSFSGRAPRTRPRATLYLWIGAQQLHAAVLSEGRWHTDTVQEVMPTKSDAGSSNTSLDVLIDSLQCLQRDLKKSFKIPENPYRSVDVRVGISDRWLPSETVPWSEALVSSEILAVVTEHLLQSGFSLPLDGVVRWEDTPWGSSRWAVAYPGLVIQALEQLARSINGRLVSVMPASSIAAHQFGLPHNGSGVVGYIEPGIFNVVEVDGGSVLSTMQRSFDIALPDLDARSQSDNIVRLWSGIQMRTPHFQSVTELKVLQEKPTSELTDKPGVKLIAWTASTQNHVPPMLCALREMGSQWHSLDAIMPRVTLTVRNTLPLVAAGLLVLALIWTFGVNIQTTSQLEDTRQIARSTVARSGPVPVSKALQEQVFAVNGAISQLNMPVDNLLRALHPPKDIRVTLLAIDLNESASEGELPKLKLNAEALSGEDMTRYLAFLYGRRPFVHAYLLRHEVIQNLPERPWRFSMELTWHL